MSMEKKEIQTKKNEIRFTTTDPQEMVGKYLAANVVRTWKEDFEDESTGEVIDIERTEILFNKGTFLDADGERVSRQPYDFMIRTKNVDTAKLVITAWINAKLKENARRAEETGDYDPAHTAEISITSASPFNIESN